KLKVGQKIFLQKNIWGELIQKGDQVNLVKFNCSDKKLFSLGVTPTPPYIKRKAKLEDYQTIYAKSMGSVAAPTAGLHFTKRLLDKLKKKGVQIEYLTLHVGMGTFAPVKSENILEHKMHSELAIVDGKTADRLNKYKHDGKRIVAVGTTSVRTLEALAGEDRKIKAGEKWVNIFIYPGYKFKFVDSIITNFHLPKSTLMMLVSAFAEATADKSASSGVNKIKKAYAEAIKKEYRFYSFGDAMMIN
ncbi:MAG: tRNA preQ1(34) S-adenosylmethionine ribosyltransferase-isomerase QueA, partial [Patescibacteria group bacterium]